MSCRIIFLLFFCDLFIFFWFLWSETLFLQIEGPWSPLCLFSSEKDHETLKTVWRLRIHPSTRRVECPSHVIEIFVSGKERWAYLPCFISALRTLVSFRWSLLWNCPILDSSSFFLSPLNSPWLLLFFGFLKITSKRGWGFWWEGGRSLDSFWYCL